MRSSDEILALYVDRRKASAATRAAGQLLISVYNGEHRVVLPELESQERAAVSNKILTGIDQHAIRIASTEPVIDCPPLKQGPRAKKLAAERKNTLAAWAHLNHLTIQRHYRARDLIALATAPVFVRPGKDGYPVWERWKPLNTFAAPCPDEDMVPPDAMHVSRRTLRWMNIAYPEQTPQLSRRNNWSWDDFIDLVHYVDSEQITLIAMGQSNERGQFNHQILTTTPNLAGCPLVVVPGRITLDRLQGQFDQMIGMYETEAKLWALHLHAVVRGIFGEKWAVGDNVEIITQADPYDGTMGQVVGGDIKEMRLDPGFQQLNSIDRLEAAQRQVGAVPAEFGGEGSGNVRTGRRGAQVISASVDFPIKEHQELLALSRECENYAAIKIAKAWWPNTTRTFVVPFLREPVVYTPADTFETEAQFVRYPYAGTDTNGLVIEGGQRIGMGTMSSESFMENDPMIHDVDAEKDRITLEGIERAFLSSIQTQAADPNSPYTPDDLAYLVQEIWERNTPLYKAVQKLQTRKQEEQAAAAQGQLGPTAMQPGLGMAGAPGSLDQAAAIGEPAPSMGNLTSLLANLRLQQREAPAEAASTLG